MYPQRRPLHAPLWENNIPFLLGGKGYRKWQMTRSSLFALQFAGIFMTGKSFQVVQSWPAMQATMWVSSHRLNIPSKRKIFKREVVFSFSSTLALLCGLFVHELALFGLERLLRPFPKNPLCFFLNLNLRSEHDRNSQSEWKIVEALKTIFHKHRQNDPDGIFLIHECSVTWNLMVNYVEGLNVWMFWFNILGKRDTC